LVPIPFLGAAAWAGRKATEKATEKATQGINKVQNETEREKTLSRYWSMKAFLIYLGLPATDDPLYAVFEPTRLKLKQIYGAKPEDDLCKMKPTAEQHEEIKKMRAENTVIDLEKLGLSLLQVLWHAYYCWDLLYWDTMTNGICKLAHANETKAQQSIRRQHIVQVTKSLAIRNSNIQLLKEEQISVFFPNFALNSPDFIEFMERKMDGLHLVDLGICAPLLYRSSQRLLKVACNQGKAWVLWNEDKTAIRGGVLVEYPKTSLIGRHQFLELHDIREFSLKEYRQLSKYYKYLYEAMEKLRKKEKGNLMVLRNIVDLESCKAGDAAEELIRAVACNTPCPTVALIHEARTELSTILEKLGFQLMERIPAHSLLRLKQARGKHFLLFRHEADTPQALPGDQGGEDSTETSSSSASDK